MVLRSQMRVAFIVLALVLAACSSSGSPKTCTPGASVQCTCANGESGAQVCASDGTLGACSCQGGTGGSGAGSGTGGAKATGGASGSGGSGNGGTSGGATATGQFTVTYDGSLMKTLSTCYNCLAVYVASSNTVNATYSFTVDTGHTTVSMTIRPATAGGNEISVQFSEGNPTVPTALEGTYLTSPQFVPAGSSCATFTTLTESQGGMMAGSLDCTLSGGNDTTPHTAVVRGTFMATFP